MFKQIMNVLSIAFISVGLLCSIAHIIYLLFKPKGWERLSFFSRHPTKPLLFLYLLMVIGCCIKALQYKMGY